jgi:hypothetical protein
MIYMIGEGNDRLQLNFNMQIEVKIGEKQVVIVRLLITINRK